MKVYFLGTAGWIPKDDETSCFLVEEDNQLIMLDAGTGVSNLRNYRELLDKYDELTIILSHYHLDHLVGFIYLLPYVKDKTITIYGPGKPYYNKSTEQILNELLKEEIFSCPLMHFSKSVNCIDYCGKSFSIGRTSVGIKQQQHSAPSFQIMINKKLIYATDTQFDKNYWQSMNYKDVTILHECWEVSNGSQKKHTSIDSLIEGIPEKLQRNTYLIHKNPEWTENDNLMMEKIIESTGIKIAKDGMMLEI